MKKITLLLSCIALCMSLHAQILYGTTTDGGVNGKSTISKLVSSTNTLTAAFTFDYPDGSNPGGSLVQATDGKLYGMTTYGGSSGSGIAFSFEPSTATYNRLADFNGTNGKSPKYTFFTEIACVGNTYYQDADGDGFGDANNSITQCTQAEGYITDNRDCDDANKDIHPGATEIPDDGIDQDCDGSDLKTWYADSDGDGFGELIDTTTSNIQPKYYVADHTDCNDADKTIYPNAPELCDGKDNDCDGTIDEDCSVVKVKINDVMISEGNSGQNNLKFTVVLSVTPVHTVTVDYRTVDITAEAAADFVAQSGTLTFNPGVKRQKINIPVKGDLVSEDNEIFKVVLSNAVNASIKVGTGIGVIFNDDMATSITRTAGSSIAPSFSISPNPASDISRIKLNGYTSKVTLQLMNMDGKVVKEKKLQTDNFKYAQQQFDVSGLASGTYSIVAVDEQGNKQSRQLIVVH